MHLVGVALGELLQVIVAAYTCFTHHIATHHIATKSEQHCQRVDTKEETNYKAVEYNVVYLLEEPSHRARFFLFFLFVLLITTSVSVDLWPTSLTSLVCVECLSTTWTHGAELHSDTRPTKGHTTTHPSSKQTT